MDWIHLNKDFRLRSSSKLGSVCIAAYIGGEKADCEFSGQRVDYQHRTDVAMKGIMIPDGAPDWMKELEREGVPLQEFGRVLELEESRNINQYHRKKSADQIEAYQAKAMTDGRYIAALPIELDVEQNKALALEFLKDVFVDRGYAVAYAFHDDAKNPHLHIISATRHVTPEGLGARAPSYNRRAQRRDSLQHEREQFAAIGNRHLMLHGFQPRLDNRSYVAQGIDLEPTIHEGYWGRKLAADGAGSELVSENERRRAENLDRLRSDLSPVIRAVANHNAVFTEAQLKRELFTLVRGDETEFKALEHELMAHPLLQSVGKDVRGNILYSTEELVDGEKTLLADLDTLAQGQRIEAIPHSLVEQVLSEKHVQLLDPSGAEQRTAVEAAISRHQLTTISGRAGTGKTTLLKAVNDIYTAAGYDVHGFALAGAAASNLEEETGIASMTLDRLAMLMGRKQQLETEIRYLLDEGSKRRQHLERGLAQEEAAAAFGMRKEGMPAKAARLSFDADMSPRVFARSPLSATVTHGLGLTGEVVGAKLIPVPRVGLRISDSHEVYLRSPVRFSLKRGIYFSANVIGLRKIPDAVQGVAYRSETPGRESILTRPEDDKLRQAEDELAKIQKTLGLSKKSVLVIDEAGMAGQKHGAIVAQLAREFGAKTIWVGDENQFKPISAGDPFRQAVERSRSHVTISRVRRQAVDWQREASEMLAAKNVGTALKAYDLHGNVSGHGTVADARAALVERYFADRQAFGHSAKDQLVLSFTNDDVSALNQAIRSRLVESGVVRDDLALNSKSFGVGDRIVFTQNRKKTPLVTTLNPKKQEVPASVMNGTFGTVVGFEEKDGKTLMLVARDKGGVPLRVDARAMAMEIEHAYAVTFHKSQGQTVPRSYLLASDLPRDDAAYVSLTRHTQDTRVFWSRDRFDGVDDMIRRWERPSYKATLDDVRRLAETDQFARVTEYVSLRRSIAETTRTIEKTKLAGLPVDAALMNRLQADGAARVFVANAILADEPGHALALKQAGLHLDRVREDAGVKPRPILQSDAEAREVLAAYRAANTEARAIYAEITQTHKGAAVNLHPRFKAFAEIRAERDRMASAMVAGPANVYRRNAKDMDISWNAIRTQATAHHDRLKKQAAMAALKAEDDQIHTALAQYRQARLTAAGLKQSGQGQAPIYLEQLAKAERFAAEVMQRWDRYEYAAKTLGIADDLLAHHAARGEIRLAVDTLKAATPEVRPKLEEALRITVDQFSRAYERPAAAMMKDAGLDWKSFRQRHPRNGKGLSTLDGLTDPNRYLAGLSRHERREVLQAFRAALAPLDPYSRRRAIRDMADQLRPTRVRAEAVRWNGAQSRLAKSKTPAELDRAQAAIAKLPPRRELAFKAPFEEVARARPLDPARLAPSRVTLSDGQQQALREAARVGINRQRETVVQKQAAPSPRPAQEPTTADRMIERLQSRGLAVPAPLLQQQTARTEIRAAVAALVSAAPEERASLEQALRSLVGKHGPAYEREAADLLRAERLNPSILVGAVNRPAVQQAATNPVAGAHTPSAPVDPAPRPSALERIRAIGRETGVSPAASAPAAPIVPVNPGQPGGAAATPSSPQPSALERLRAIRRQSAADAGASATTSPVSVKPAASDVMAGRAGTPNDTPAVPRKDRQEILDRLNKSVSALKADTASRPSAIDRIRAIGKNTPPPVPAQSKPDVAPPVDREALNKKIDEIASALQQQKLRATEKLDGVQGMSKSLAKTVSHMKDNQEDDPAGKMALKAADKIVDVAADAANKLVPGVGTAIKVIKRLGPKV